MSGADNPSDIALRALAGFIPRDAGQVAEVGARDDGSSAPLFRRWNGATRFTTLPLGAGRPAGAEDGYDCVTLRDGFATAEHPIEVLRAASQLLKPAAPLIALMPPLRGGMAARLGAFLGEAGLKLDQAVPIDAAETRFLVRALPQAAPLQRMLIQNMVLRPIGGLNDKRITEPSAFLATIPGVHVVTRVNQAAWQPLPGDVIRVLVVQRRLLARREVPSLRRTAERGYLMVCEFDDHPSRWPFIAEQDHATFRAAHAVQTSTPMLADELAPYSIEVAVFANQMAELAEPRRLSGEGPATLFFGAFNREAEWAPLMPVLQEVIASHGERLRFQVVHDRAFFDALPTEAKTFTSLCPYDRYLEIMAASDIALLPLSDTLFNRCKSDLKFIECAAHQVVALASPVVYGDSVADGRTGLLFHSPEEFGDKLRFLLDHPDQRLAIANQARDWVAAHRLQVQHYRRRYDWYRSLAARKPALDADFYRQMDALEATDGHASAD